MPVKLRQSLVTVVLLAAFFVVGPRVADATVKIRTERICCTFTQGSFTGKPGEKATFTSPAGSDAGHNVTASRRRSDGRPLFSSKTVIGKTTSVPGVQFLKRGRYPFVCTIHPQFMRGVLVVTGRGKPQRKPGE